MRLVIEVVSTNWQDDYGMKLLDYEAMGIPEYWMVEHYAGRGGRRYIGVPKRPTLSVCLLVDGEYEIRQFRGNESIISACFPDLQLTAEQVFGVAT